MRRREEHCLKPGRREEGGNLVTFTTPVSIKPSAKMGETFQEGGRGRLNVGAGKQNLGPAPPNVKPNQSLEEACDGRIATRTALENCQN